MYLNESDDQIEAKYKFPLDSMAAVCGFEAYINGKHVIGKVKEKVSFNGSKIYNENIEQINSSSSLMAHRSKRKKNIEKQLPGEMARTSWKKNPKERFLQSQLEICHHTLYA